MPNDLYQYLQWLIMSSAPDELVLLELQLLSHDVRGGVDLPYLICYSNTGQRPQLSMKPNNGCVISFSQALH